MDSIEKIKMGYNVFIFYPYKNDSGRFKSMETIFNMITSSTGKKGVYINADIDDLIKKELKNVNEFWKEKDFVITNNVITCGVNYDTEDFDYTYLFIANFNSMRDIIQISYRCRYISTQTIYVSFMGRMKQTNTWVNDCNNMNCNIYSDLYKSILIEKKAPIRKSFNYFCVKANYKQIAEPKIINCITTKEYEKLSDESSSYSHDYNNIEDIDYETAERLQIQTILQKATMDEKFCLKKYFFKLQFDFESFNKIFYFTDNNYTLEINMLKHIFDNKYDKMIEPIIQLVLKPDNLFNKIKDLNKLETIFPTDITKTKIDDEIKTLIFQNFSFKYLKKTSKLSLILKEIYNIYFKCYLITTSQDTNHRTIFHIETSHLNQIYNFIIKYSNKFFLQNHYQYDTNNNLFTIDNSLHYQCDN
jgi:hypothetical protein